MRPKLSQTIEEKLEEYNVVKKLTELESLVTSTQHSRKHQAWRPPSGSGSDGVKMTMAAHDYVVLNFIITRNGFRGPDSIIINDVNDKKPLSLRAIQCFQCFMMPTSHMTLRCQFMRTR